MTKPEACAGRSKGQNPRLEGGPDPYTATDPVPTEKSVEKRQDSPRVGNKYLQPGLRNALRQGSFWVACEGRGICLAEVITRGKVPPPLAAILFTPTCKSSVPQSKAGNHLQVGSDSQDKLSWLGKAVP